MLNLQLLTVLISCNVLYFNNCFCSAGIEFHRDLQKICNSQCNYNWYFLLILKQINQTATNATQYLEIAYLTQCSTSCRPKCRTKWFWSFAAIMKPHSTHSADCSLKDSHSYKQVYKHNPLNDIHNR